MLGKSINIPAVHN